AGELFQQKAIERLVVVEGVDDPIAILPRERLDRVALVTVGFGKTDQVEPVPAPALAKMVTRQQTIDQPLVSIGAGVVDEGLHRFRFRRQSPEVEVETPNEYLL